jgi:nitrogen fixation NifU-like protein
MSLESMYQEIILEHYKHPQGKGLQPDFQAEVHHVNPTCGDEITLRATVDDDGVIHVSYDNQGCSISQASASVMWELVNNQKVDSAFATEAAFLELMQSRGQLEGDEDVLADAVAFSGVSQFPARVKCALLSWMAMKDAVSQIVRLEKS